MAIYGAGGFGKEVASILHKINEIAPAWNLIGFFDDGVVRGSEISHFGCVLGGLHELNNWQSSLAVVFAIGNPSTIRMLVEKIVNININYPNIIHPEVYLADEQSFVMGRGNVVVRGCSFSVDVTIGDFNQFNSMVALGHDVQVGSFNVFMPLTRISGNVAVNNECIFGLNTLVIQSIRIGSGVRTGPGAVVMTKPKDNTLYMGNPARKTIL